MTDSVWEMDILDYVKDNPDCTLSKLHAKYGAGLSYPGFKHRVWRMEQRGLLHTCKRYGRLFVEARS